MKVLFFDIDGTLCPFGKKPGKRTMEMIHRAQKNGHKAFICTGRTPAALDPYLLQCGFDGIIAAAGNYAEWNGKVVVDHPMTEEMRKKVIRLLDDNQVLYTMECKLGNYSSPQEKHWAGRLSPKEALAFKVANQVLEKSMKFQPLANYPGEPVYKFCFTCVEASQMDQPTEMLKNDFDVVFQKNSFPDIPVQVGELIPKIRNKGTALREVCAAIGVSTEQAIAFGDSFNDLPMLEAAGTAVVMENADPGLYPYASLIAPPCKDQGVADALIQLGLTE